MVKRMFKKGLIVGIIILFISTSGLTSVSSKDISISIDKISEDSNEIESRDINIEIFTYINGRCDSASARKTGESIYRDVELWSGNDELMIMGIGFPFLIFIKYVSELSIPCFIGDIYTERTPHVVIGYAFGNIEQN